MKDDEEGGSHTWIGVKSAKAAGSKLHRKTDNNTVHTITALILDVALTFFLKGKKNCYAQASHVCVLCYCYCYCHWLLTLKEKTKVLREQEEELGGWKKRIFDSRESKIFYRFRYFDNSSQIEFAGDWGEKRAGWMGN